MMTNEPCILVENLVKAYKTYSANVIDDISFVIDYGSVFGFLGPNGAGKTTTVKILTGFFPHHLGKSKYLVKISKIVLMKLKNKLVL